MSWESWSAFWDMGGAAFYVWGSYGLALALVALELMFVLQRRKDTTRRLLRWRRALGKDAGRQNGGEPEPVTESER